MRLIKYSLHSPRENRNLDKIIDWANSSYSVNGYILTGNFKTTTPHKLIEGEELAVMLNKINYIVDFIISNEYEFQFSIDLREQLSISNIVKDVDGQVAVLLDNPIQKHTGSNFSLYNGNGEVLFTGCNFYSRNDGTILYGLFNIPRFYYQGFILEENYGPIYISDDRAFDWETGEIFTGTTSISVAQKHISVQVPLSQENSIDLGQDDLYSNLMEEEIKDTLIDRPADMEKQVFEPYEMSGDDKIRISEIDFHIHCRQRDTDNNWKIITTGVNKEEWWHLDDADAKSADDLSYLGFNEDDIKFQKKRLKKSFLRLSFYDSTDKLDQNLLGYSTIFYDTNTSYSTWNKNHIKIEANGWDSNDLEPKEKAQLDRIDGTFIVTDRYNYAASSEGFYIYLFPDQLLKTDGDTIYMKVDFNNAKYGKTVNLALPRDKEGNVVEFSGNSDFRTSYLKYTLDESGNPTDFYTDTDALANDLYAEVKIGYDEDMQKYTYSFPWANPAENGVLDIHFFEPKGN